MMESRSAPVLVLSDDPGLRNSLSHNLAKSGFETVPTVSAAEAESFFGVLEPQLVVAPFSVLGRGIAFIDQLASAPSQKATLAIIGDSPEQEKLLTRAVVFVCAQNLTAEQLTEKILLLLLGKKLHLAANHTVDRLVGSLAQRPFFELIRDLVAISESAHVEITGYGECWTRSGEVIAARAGPASGEKAFCRLARCQEGAFQVRREENLLDADVTTPWDELMAQAIHESLISLPALDWRLRLQVGEGFFDREYNSLEQSLLRLAQHGSSVEDALNCSSATDGLIAEQLQKLVQLGVLQLEAPHRPLRIVTDSTADLTTALKDKISVVTLPLTVHFGDRVFREGIDIQPKNFYQLLSSDPNHPRSNPPPVELFQQTFSAIGGDTDILSIHLSHKLSETLNNARAAVQALESTQESSSYRIRIVDSQQVSLGLGLLTLLASRLAAQYQDLETLGAHVEHISKGIKTLFAVDTLTYLERGGRINKARAWLGSLLQVKPILGLEAGEVVALDRVRGGRAAYPRLAELLAQRVDPKREIIAMVAHANAPQWADRLRGLIEENFQCREITVVEIGPVVGTHTGPGTVGVAAYQPTAEELPWLREPR